MHQALPLNDGTRFQVVRVGNRPLIALPSTSARVRRAAIWCYPAHSWKKVLVRSAISAAISSGISRLLWKNSLLPFDGPENSNLGTWLDAIRARLGQPDLKPVVVWPSRFSRGRIYVHLLDMKGRVRAFGKLALDRENSELIENERRALEDLHSRTLKRCKVPQILDSGRFGELASLVVETLPDNARVTNWATDLSLTECIREYSGETQTVPLAEIQQEGWWQEFQRISGSMAAFAALVHETSSDNVEVCRVHGDLNRTNVMRCGDEVWLVDWEQSCEQGPSLTDFLCIDVDQRWPATSRDPAASLANFLAAEWDRRGAADRRRVLMALAFLHAAGFPPASVLVQHWDRALRMGNLGRLSAK
jgi:hypothetical protein